MFAPLAKFIDWSVIQAVTMLLPRVEGRGPRLEEALQFLGRTSSMLNDHQPARLEFESKEPARDFQFPSPRPGAFAENNVVYGRLYRCNSQRWRERPVIILLHGGGGFEYRFTFPSVARRCNEAGLNAATLVGPYHFQRRPYGIRSWSGRDYLEFSELMAQAICEVQALIGWLGEQGCSSLALWGCSMGGWLAGLAARYDSRLTSLVMMVPAVRMELAAGERIIWRQLREGWARQRAALGALNGTWLNLTLGQPAISPKNILLIEGLHDLFVGTKPIEDLWNAWDRPDIWRLPHGHVSSLGALSTGLARRVLDWLAPRLNRHTEITGSC